MELQEIIGRRLRNARIMRGLSMDQLCNKMDSIVSKMAISKYENGKMNPNSSVLIAFSEALDLPVDYFVRPFTLKIESVKFRKRKSNLGVKAEEGIKQNIASLTENYMEIEEICNEHVEFTTPFNNQVIRNKEDIYKAATQLRDFWNLGSDGIVNVINLLEEHGVKVLEIDAPLSFDGLSSLVNDRYPVIVINRNFTPERKRFTSLHELGHIILPFEEDIEEKEEEKLCNCFANEMLVPQTTFKNLIGNHRTDIAYEEMKALQIQYGISCDAMMYKAKDTEIISDQRFKTYCIRKNQDRIFKETVEQSLYPQEESSRYRRLVFKALSSEDITTSKAAALLNESVDKVREALSIV